jgi:uncharacterized protein YbjT (DUF2867 family)
MTLLIVGATGTLGRQIVRRALDEGQQVRCLVRSSRRAAFLREWGAELYLGNLNDPDGLDLLLAGVTTIVDAATARATDSLGVRQVDWEGKVNLIQAAQRANIQRYIFFSIHDAEKHPNVPLMQIKTCTEKFLAESGVPYTIFRPAGFLQGLIGQYAMPILEGQSIWVTGESSPIAYLDTQDIAKFAVRALQLPETVGRTYPLVGDRAWKGEELVSICERLSGKEAKVTRLPLSAIRTLRGALMWFQWAWNAADRLAFAEVIANGRPMIADMTEVYQTFGIDAKEITTVDGYLQEYFSRIGRKIKELEYEREKQKQRKAEKKSKKKMFY